MFGSLAIDALRGTAVGVTQVGEDYGMAEARYAFKTSTGAHAHSSWAS